MKDPSPNVVASVTIERPCTCLRCSEGVEVHPDIPVELLVSGLCEWDTGGIYSEICDVESSSHPKEIRTGDPVDLTPREMEMVRDALQEEFERLAESRAEAYRESFPSPLRLRPSHHRRTA